MEPNRVPGDFARCPGQAILILHHPGLTVILQAYAFISLFVVILSTVTFVLSTTPQLAPEMDLILFDIEDENSTDTKAVERWDEVSLSEKYWLRMHLYVQQTTFHCLTYMTVKIIKPSLVLITYIE